MLTLGAGCVTLFDPDRPRANGLAESLCARFGPGKAAASENLATAVAQADGLVHATPTGMASHPGLPLPAELLHSALWVAEIVYFPLQTALLQTARRIGCHTLDGGGMAVFQAAEAFRLFTGTTPDTQRMLDHFASMSTA
jgi:shikimate dehydrogenase